jgi:PST family polysaccharide transporter
MMRDRDSLTAQTARAGHWRLAGSMLGALTQLVVGVVLARLLTPTDFGVIALAYVVLAVAQPWIDLGLANAVVHRRDLTVRHIRTAFTTTTVLGSAAAALLVAAAPAAASLTRSPEIAPVLRVLALGFAFKAVGTIAEALLRRRLDFKHQVLIETGSYVAGYGFVAIALAANGYGLWSLVAGNLIQTIGASSAQLVLVRHPLRPLLARRELSELLAFGLGAALSRCVNYIALNADYFVVGRGMGTANLGLYTRAYGLMTLPHTYFATVVTRVMFPAFARVQEDVARLRRGYLLLTDLTARIAAPALGTLAVVAPHFVLSVYGPQWTGVVRPLQVFCVAGYFRALYHLGGVLAQSAGRVYDELRLEIVYAVLVIAGALAGSRISLTAVAIGVSGAILYMFIACASLARRVTGTPWREYLGVQRPAVLNAAATGGVALAIRLLLEAARVPSVWIVCGVVAGAAAPAALGIVAGLRQPEWQPLQPWLPRWSVRLVEALSWR